MQEYEFLNSANECCPKDGEGNLITPNRAPLVRDADGNARTPYGAPTAPGERANGESGVGEGGIISPPENDFNTEAFQGSMQQILSDNVGQFVVCEFIAGTGPTLTVKEGILYSVGRSFIVLYEELNRNYVVCDIFSIKFVTFYLPGERPKRYGGNNTAAAGRGRR